MTEFTRLDDDVDPSDDPARGPGFKIAKVTLFVGVDADGAEGLIAWQTEDGTFMPLVVTDDHRRELFREVAIKCGRSGRREVREIAFTVREDLGAVYVPPPKG